MIEQNIGRGIKPYSAENLEVTLTYQNFGSTWLCILRGSKEDIDLAFNGFFNYRGTNGEYEFFDHTQNVAVFWSDKRALRRFFFNRYFMPRFDNGNAVNQGRLIRDAMKYAHKKILALRANGHESIMDFSNCYEPVCHQVGKIRAENPDSDMKDAILEHSFQRE